MSKRVSRTRPKRKAAVLAPEPESPTEEDNDATTDPLEAGGDAGPTLTLHSNRDDALRTAVSDEPVRIADSEVNQRTREQEEVRRIDQQIKELRACTCSSNVCLREACKLLLNSTCLCV
jgi:hypothetical protein